MNLTRRRLLATFMTAGAAASLPRTVRAQTSAAGVSAGKTSSPLPAELKAGDSTHRLAPDQPPLRLWTYNDSFPGPVLRVRQGEEIALRLKNDLPQPTSIHWAGARIANAADGVAGLTQDAVAPGATQDIAFTPREAGTILYRPMITGHAAEQVERGLHGVLIVDEDEPPYADDFVLVLDDIALDGDGQVRDDFNVANNGVGRLGNRLLMNGATAPETLTRPPGHRLRIRLVNSANARPLTLGFDNLAVHIIAADSQPVDDPFPPSQDRLALAPGNRVDIVVTTPSRGATGAIIAQLGDGLPLLKLAGSDAPAVDVPDRVTPLAANPLLPSAIDLAAARRFDIRISGGADAGAQDLAGGETASRLWQLGGVSWPDASERPLFSVPRNTPVVLSLENTTAVLQVLHLHGHHARQLHGLDDGWEPYWLDTIPVRAGQTVRIAFLADNPGRWMIGSAILDHLGTGLAGWFEVS